MTKDETIKLVSDNSLESLVAVDVDFNKPSNAEEIIHQLKQIIANIETLDKEQVNSKFGLACFVVNASKNGQFRMWDAININSATMIGLLQTQLVQLSIRYNNSEEVG